MDERTKDALSRSNFTLLETLFGGSLDTLPEAAQSKVEGMMDLHFDRIIHQDGKWIVALSHYYMHPSADMIADPDMELLIDLKAQTAVAIAYQDSFGYNRSHDFRGGQMIAVQAGLYEQINRFLTQWLKNCIDQGHSLSQGVDANGAKP